MLAKEPENRGHLAMPGNKLDPATGRGEQPHRRQHYLHNKGSFQPSVSVLKYYKGIIAQTFSGSRSIKKNWILVLDQT